MVPASIPIVKGLTIDPKALRWLDIDLVKLLTLRIVKDYIQELFPYIISGCFTFRNFFHRSTKTVAVMSNRISHLVCQLSIYMHALANLCMCVFSLMIS